MVTEEGEQATAAQHAYLESLTALEASYRRLEGELTEALATIRAMHALLRGGGRPKEFLESGRPQSARRNVGARLADAERARHVSDRLLFRLLHADGTSAAEMGRMFGVSRALVSRLINEPDAGGTRHRILASPG